MTGVISYGGGVQSTALLALAINGDIDAVAAVHANVGDDSEHPDTVAYIRDVAQPACDAASFPLHIVQNDRTLRDMLMNDEKFQGIPIRMSQSGAPGRRTCTARFKVQPITRWKKANGYSDYATYLGISVDEYQRAHRGRSGDQPEYPLLDLDMTRADCLTYLRDHGWPEPRPSACYFCPYHTIGHWQEMARDDPELFTDSVAIEARINEKRPEDDPAWLSSRGIPLDLAINAAQDHLFDACDTGYCFV